MAANNALSMFIVKIHCEASPAAAGLSEEAGGINLIYLDHGKLGLGIFCWIGVSLIIIVLIGFSILNLDGNLRSEHLNLVFNTFY